MAINYYFANDGAFGEAIDGFICDTSNWTDHDWEVITDVADDVRPHLAVILTEYRGGEITRMAGADPAVCEPDLVQECIDLLEPVHTSHG